MKKSVRFILVLLAVASFFPNKNLLAQRRSLSYSIISKNDTAGRMQIVQVSSGNDVTYSVASSVTTKLLMTVKVNVQEEAQYHNRKLIVSSSQRTINDKPKPYRQTKAMNDFYILSNEGNNDTLQEKEITYDFSMLYFKEPAGIKQVYSNYYQKQLPIVSQEDHGYKIDLPEGGSNTYYYANGICTRVELHSSLFNAQMILNP